MFDKILITFVLGLSSQPGWAQKKKPVSVSYENLVRCFPELQNEDLSFKVDLNKLKEVADEKFVTTQSLLRQRKVRYLDAGNNDMILTLTTTVQGLKASTELALQAVDEKGVITDNSLTKNQRSNPKQEIVNSFLLNANIKSDEYSYNDTKLNGVEATYRRNFKDIVEYDLDEKAGSRSVNCEKQKDLGIICTCTKK
ncbi:MAG: hypothetical protein ACM3MG_05040 [Bacillota bacterium]